MSVAAGSSSLAYSPDLDDRTAAMLSIFSCAGIKRGSATYISTPITTGELLIEWHERGHASASREEVKRDVISRNTRALGPLLTEVREHWPTSSIIEPSSLMDVPGWVQANYHKFWCATVAIYSQRVVFNAGWYLSNGCALEYEAAVLTEKPVFDDLMRPISHSTAMSAIRQTIQRLEAADMDATVISGVFERLR